MRVLLCHNHYQQRGGECMVFEEEAELLAKRGHHVVRYTLHNDEIDGASRIATAAKTFWNRTAYREIRELIRRERPDVMHCTNTFPLISPAAYDAADAEGVPVVQALHNYRLLCVNAQLLRDGEVCESCVGRPFAWPGVVRGCYRGSRLISLTVAASTAAHRVIGTWGRKVDQYYTCTEFARTRFVKAGFDRERIAVKANFLSHDPGEGPGDEGYAVFVGRLSPEKGIDGLLQAWERVGERVRLVIVGDGPLAPQVRAAGESNANITWLGQQSHGETLRVIGGASCLVMPSISYETFGRTIVEAYAKGTPVIVSDLGAMAELVSYGETGLRVPAGDAGALADAVCGLAGDEAMRRRMRAAARAEYLAKFTADANYPILMDIYTRAINRGRQAAASRLPAASVGDSLS